MRTYTRKDVTNAYNQGKEAQRESDALLSELNPLLCSTKFVLRGKPKQTGEWRDINEFRNRGNAKVEYDQYTRYIGSPDYGWEAIELVTREIIVKDTTIISV